MRLRFLGLLPAVELPQPPIDGLDLPPVRLPDELGLGLDVEDAVRVPVVPGARDEVLRVQVGRRGPRRREVGVVAQVVPHVLVPVDERQPVRAEVERPEVVVRVDVRRRRDRVAHAGRERPRAPLLLIAGIHNSGQQSRSFFRSLDVRALECSKLVPRSSIKMLQGDPHLLYTARVKI